MVLVYLYAAGAPLFAFLAWVFSEAFRTGEAVDRRIRVPLIMAAGALWPLLLLGVAQIQAVRIRANMFSS
jgi:hypothetical protein